MHLNELYALSCGLRMGKQFLLETFYPLPFTKYITLHASSGMAAKNYPFYGEVIRLVANVLDSQGIKIVQLGGPDDTPIAGCFCLSGKTSKHQTGYILKGSLAHLGNDSWLAHRAGALKIPLITLFGPTAPDNHGAFFRDPEKTIFLESHRWGRNPSFASQESPPSIGLIPPEEVANAVLSILGIKDKISQQTRFIGSLSGVHIIDLIPNSVVSPTFLPDLPITIRMDYMHNEGVLAQVLSTGRRINLLVTKPVDLGLLSHYRAQILSYTHELGALGITDADWPTADYLTNVRAIIPKHAFFARNKSEEEIAAIRFRYLDICMVESAKDPTKEDYLMAALTYLNRKDTPENRLDIAQEVAQNGGTLQFRTQRFILSDGLIFTSYPHMHANQSITSLGHNVGTVVDDPAFFRDLNHYTLFFQPNVL